MTFPIVVPMTISSTETTIPFDITSNTVSLDVDIGMRMTVVDAENYDGEYVFTPTTSSQTVHIAKKRAMENIIINPIPQNYGLITWNGTTLTVS